METTFRVFDEYLKSKDLNIVRGLTIAIELEMKSRQYYQSKMNEIKNQTGRSLLSFLANEELAHLKILEDVKQKMEGNKKWIEIKEINPREIPKPRLFDGKQTEPRIEFASNDRDILLAAMNAERKSEEYYARMSSRTKDLKGKGFFETLARFEKDHYDTIRGFLV